MKAPVMNAPGPVNLVTNQCEEREIDNFVKTQTSYDADIWIIEVEDRQGRHFLDNQVQTL